VEKSLKIRGDIDAGSSSQQQGMNCATDWILFVLTPHMAYNLFVL
jgi:hypothetical protein